MHDVASCSKLMHDVARCSKREQSAASCSNSVASVSISLLLNQSVALVSYHLRRKGMYEFDEDADMHLISAVKK